MKELTPTPLDLLRDLGADLADLKASCWSATCHTIPAHEAALRRAIAAETERDNLRALLVASEAQVRSLCPLGDLAGLPAWMAEARAYQEEISELEAALLRTGALVASTVDVLRRLSLLVQKARAAQRSYFREASPGRLQEAKRLERELDDAAAAALEPPGLFDRGGIP